MFHAIVCATRHSCLKRGVGAVIVKDRRIIATGYNGAARGITSCRELGYCYYEKLSRRESVINGKNIEDIKEVFKVYCQAVHAESNAISQAFRDVSGSDLYVTNYPCPKCTQDIIITNMFKRVFVWKDYLSNPTLTIDEKKASDVKLSASGIPINYVELEEGRILEIASYMAQNVGERTTYRYKERLDK
jgi:dCMP deaminase